MKIILQKKYLITLYILLGFVFLCKAQVNYTEEDSLIFKKYCEAFYIKRNLCLSDLTTETALYFQGTPYVASTLDKNTDKEKLVINLREFDCTTFVENCIALSLVIKSENCNFKNYCHILQQLRYRTGIIDDYSSRLHYASDWIFENVSKNIFSDISRTIGGQLIAKEINFMSTHPQSYPQLEKDKKMQGKIKNIEQSLNKRSGLYVIEKQKIENIDKDIKNGDIILFSTLIEGLDFTHMGIAYVDNDRVSFIHASSLAKKVIIEKHTLSQYCLSSKRCNGIVVLRLNMDNNN
ncbi:MAG: N-acetylmuramoyl-L-alanine amidase-like domain-containing protein [Dysgonomonas sp.]